MSEAGQRPPISDPVKREVRQRCGFGCVVCGMPLYEYEHMLGWANVQRHVAEEITLLCDQHHREKTSGLLPASAVQSANGDPFNLRAGVSKPYTLHFSGDSCETVVGSNRVISGNAGDFAAVMIDDTPLIAFRFEDGHYLLNLVLFNESNELVLRIVDNELEYSSAPWDIELSGTQLVIRAAARNIFIDINFEPPNRVVFHRGRLLFNGIELFLRPNYVLLINNCGLFSDCSFTGTPVALNIGRASREIPSGIRWAGVPRYNIDRAAALAWAKQKTGEVLSGDADE